MPTCCIYRDPHGSGRAVACYDRAACPQLPGLELVESRHVRDCAECFRRAARLVGDPSFEPAAEAPAPPAAPPPAAPAPVAAAPPTFGAEPPSARDPLGPWRPIYPKPPRGPVIPPTTPIHPGTKMELHWDPKHGAYDVVDYVNGWCAIVWIIQTDAGKGGSPLARVTGSGHLMSDPTQQSVDAIAVSVSRANEILWQCHVAVRACEIIELDARRIYWTPQGKRFSLADSFTGDEAVISNAAGSTDFFHTLDSIVSNGTADGENDGGQTISPSAVFDRFVAKLRKPCVHLFFVRRVKDANDPKAHTAGVGGQSNYGASYGGQQVETPVGLVESTGADLGQTIAHEIGHSLGLKHAKDDSDPAVQADKDNLMQSKPTGTSLQRSQCDTMAASLKKIAPACP